MASDSDSLDSIFGDVAPKAPAPAAAPEATAQTQTGEAAPAAKAQPAAPAAPDANATPATGADEDVVEVAVRSGGRQIPLEAVLKERKQRQERQATLERELAEARGQLAVYARSQKPQPTETQQPADPDLEFLANPAKSVRGEVDKAVQSVNDRIMRMSAAQMRSAHADYEEAAQAFVEAAQRNPALERACIESDNPALFAYQNGKTYLEVKKYGGSLVGMREQIRKEEEAKAEAKYRKQGALDAAAQASTSTAGARSVGTNAPAFTGTPSFEQLFPGPLQ